MKEIIKLSLQKELKREMEEIKEEIKEEIERHPELAQMKVSEEMDAKFFERARALEAELKSKRLIEEMPEVEPEVEPLSEKTSEVERSDEEVAGVKRPCGEASETERLDGEVSEAGRTGEETAEAKVAVSVPVSSKSHFLYNSANGFGAEPVVVYRRKQKKKTLLVALVAILVLVMGMSMTSIGSKSYLKILLERFAGEDENPMKILNVEDMDTIGSDDGDEATVYKKIGEELGIYAVRIKERPENMVLVEYQIEEVLKQAKMFYRFGDEIIRYTIYLNDSNSSWGELEEDKKVDEYELIVNDVIITIREYEVEGYKIYRRVAEFSYKGVHYQLKGVMNKSDFELILKNLHFFG